MQYLSNSTSNKSPFRISDESFAEQYAKYRDAKDKKMKAAQSSQSTDSTMAVKGQDLRDERPRGCNCGVARVARWVALVFIVYLLFHTVRNYNADAQALADAQIDVLIGEIRVNCKKETASAWAWSTTRYNSTGFAIGVAKCDEKYKELALQKEGGKNLDFPAFGDITGKTLGNVLYGFLHALPLYMWIALGVLFVFTQMIDQVGQRLLTIIDVITQLGAEAFRVGIIENLKTVKDCFASVASMLCWWFSDWVAFCSVRYCCGFRRKDKQV